MWRNIQQTFTSLKESPPHPIYTQFEKTSISSCEIARALGVTQKSAWFMMHRIRLAMNQGSFEKMSGEIEADETFIGGLSRNMHQDRAEHTINYEFGLGTHEE